MDLSVKVATIGKLGVWAIGRAPVSIITWSRMDDEVLGFLQTSYCPGQHVVMFDPWPQFIPLSF